MQVHDAEHGEVELETLLLQQSSMDPGVETLLYAAVREHARILTKQEDLNYVLGRSASVAEWAAAAGYGDSMGMLAALRDGQRAQSRLIKSQRAMVAAIARRYAFLTRSLSVDDLIQEGTLGLLSAADKFDPDRGARFGTYASARVKAYILRAIANKDATIRLPVHVHDTAGRVRAAAARLAITLGRPPTDAEIAATIDMLPSEIASHRATMDKTASIASLDVPAANSHAFAANAAAASSSNSASTAAKSQEMADDLRRVLDLYLAPKEVEALQLRFGLGGAGGSGGANADGSSAAPRTFKEVGSAMHTSAEGIRRIVSRALGKLRDGEAWRLLLDYAEFV